MKKDTREAGFVLKLMLIVVSFCVIFIVFAGLLSHVGTQTGTFSFGNLTNSDSITGSDIYTKTHPMLDFGNSTSGFGNDVSRSVPNTDGAGQSPYAGKVSLSTGNTSTIQPLEEYIVLRNSGSSPVNITGWAVTNSKGSRPVQNSGNSYFYPTPGMAVIGQGTEFLDPSGKFNVGPIVLKPNDTAYVVTGGPFSQFPFSISTSFRDNICTGYIENYPFSPRLTQSCPLLANDPQIKTVTDECYDYINSLNQCANPEKDDKKVYDKQPSHCKAFITARVGYAACVAQNSNAYGFALNQWRIFLGQPREMWAQERETITLYDARGMIVDQLSY